MKILVRVAIKSGKRQCELSEIVRIRCAEWTMMTYYDYWNSPIIHATYSNDVYFFEYLISCGANVNKHIYIYMRVCIMYGYKGILRSLLQNGHVIHYKNMKFAHHEFQDNTYDIMKYFAKNHPYIEYYDGVKMTYDDAVFRIENYASDDEDDEK